MSGSADLASTQTQDGAPNAVPTSTTIEAIETGGSTTSSISEAFGTGSTTLISSPGADGTISLSPTTGSNGFIISQSIASGSISSTNDSATTTAATPAQTNSSSSTGGSKNAGAIAGASIGCLIGGLVLGFIIAWFIQRRRKQTSQGPLREVAEVTDLKAHPPTHALTITKAPSAIGRTPLDQFFLDGAPDEEVGMELRALGDLICQHVESHYHLQEIRAEEPSLSRALLDLRFGQDWGVNTETVVALCIDPKTRYAGLRHFISSVVFRSLDFDSRYPISMLPAPVAGFRRGMPPNGTQSKDSSAMILAASQWRRLSALLLHPDPSDRVPLKVSEADAAPQAADLAHALNRFLLHFVAADGPARNEQTGHLQAVIIECAKLGYALFSHPCDWAFAFRANKTTQGQGIVVCVGLNKLSHRDGKRYKTPKCIVEPLEMAT